MRPPVTGLRIDLPDWVPAAADWGRSWATDEDRAGLAIRLARENVLRETGGPFGAAIFEEATGALVGVGVNLVVPANNAVLHAETVAIMLAQARLGTFSLAAQASSRHGLYSSCEPCAMCLGAAHWSGVRRIVWSALRDDAGRFGFDEGPVFPESWAYLERSGIHLRGGVLRDEGRAVLALYRERGGTIYNA
jgi:tRNA(Arg) A34 adenosine deaminase TadA